MSFAGTRRCRAQRDGNDWRERLVDRFGGLAKIGALSRGIRTAARDQGSGRGEQRTSIHQGLNHKFPKSGLRQRSRSFARAAVVDPQREIEGSRNLAVTKDAHARDDTTTVNFERDLVVSGAVKELPFAGGEALKALIALAI